MNRRNFLKTSLATTILGSQTSFAQSLISPNATGDALLRLNPYIQPEERSEKRIYDKSRSEVVAWHSLSEEQDKRWDAVNRRSYYAKKVLRTIGFVEGVSTKEKLLYIGGILVRRDYQSTPKQGFYLYFNTSLQWLSLPRRTRKDSKLIEDRYALADSTETVEGIEKGFVSIDYRELKLIEGSRILKPTHMVYRPINSQGAYENIAPSLIPAASETTPSRFLNSDKVSVGNVLFFDIAYRPLHFKLEIPPLIIGNVEVPMPTCFFEPFDVEKSKWVDS